MLMEATFAALVFLAWRKVKGRKGLTKERRDIYLDALEHLTNPDELRMLADGFEKDGLPIEADMLRKRADLRAMPREKWENYRAICELAVQKPDADPTALDDMASAFDAMTATGTAKKLRMRAAERRMEILAYAQEQERNLIAAQSEAEGPPTPNTTGISPGHNSEVAETVEKKIEAVEKKVEATPDPDASNEPKAEEKRGGLVDPPLQSKDEIISP